MNDDWSDPTGEHEAFADIPTKDVITADGDPLLRVVDLDGVSEQDIRIVDAFFQELALDASDDPSPPTPEEQDDLDAIASFVTRLTASGRDPGASKT